MKIIYDAKIAIDMEIALNHIRIITTDLYGNEIAYQWIKFLYIGFRRILVFWYSLLLLVLELTQL